MRTGKFLAEGSHNLEIWQEESIPTLLRLKKNKRKKQPQNQNNPKPFEGCNTSTLFLQCTGYADLTHTIPYSSIILSS